MCILQNASYPQWILIQVWRFSLHHFYCHNAKGPDVHFGAIGFSSHNFWGHPVGRAHHGATFVLLRSYLSTEAKVGCRRRNKCEGLSGTLN